jgi:hypothetical protein
MLEVRGRALIQLEKWEEARQTLEECLALAQAIGSARLEWQIRLDLSIVDRRLGDTESAQVHAARAKQIVDFIAEHAGSAELKQSFLGLARVRSATQTSSK